MTRHVPSWHFVALSLVLLAASGCDVGFLEGINRPKGPGSTAQNRVELELIPNAEAYLEDTSPDWPLGRVGFKPGADKLLVLTNITSFDKRDDDGKPLNQRYDQFIERVWITIPLGTPLNQTLKAEDLEADHMVGYDVAELGVRGDRYFVQPCSVLGKVTLLAQTATTATLDLDLQITPKGMLVWNVHKITEVPITATGIHATRADLRGRGRPLAHTSQPASTQPVGPAPAATTAPATQSSESPADHSLVGRWMTRRAAPAGTTFYFQFDPNGSCAFATQTGTGSVVPRFGHYQVKGDYVIIYVDHGDAAVQKMRYVMLHIVWGGAGPQLEGDLAPEPALQALRIPLERANFPDMNVTVPKPTP